MTLEEKVARLVRYCGQYQSHGFMVDERNTDDTFHVQLPGEEEIRKSIEKLRVILLTGEAGDGKSRMLRNLRPLLEKYHFSEPCMDFSALTEEEKLQLVGCLEEIVEGRRQEKIVILANVGVFTQTVIKYDIHLMEELTGGREDIYICNFENRNLAENRDKFFEIVKEFLSYEEPCPNRECPCYGCCAYEENIQRLLKECGMEAMRTICNAVYLMGGHITFRELLSLLAYTVTFGQDCEERQRYVKQQGDMERVLYYNIFERSDDILLKKAACLDPALRRADSPEDMGKRGSKKDYIAYRRKRFFEDTEKQYRMLHADYLVEFYEVLKYMHQPPYHYDVSKDRNATLQKLKKGINKMSSRGRSDIGLILTDIPLMFDNQIRTEFLLSQDVSLIWNRYDLKIGEKAKTPDKLWNKFCLSYMVKGEKKGLISLLIDYRQFRYLMMCSDDYFMNRNELSIEEYAVNTFYRKILQTKAQAYDSVVIRFEEKTEDICDFSLTVHENEDFFTEEKEQSIRIRKEE